MKIKNWKKNVSSVFLTILRNTYKSNFEKCHSVTCHSSNFGIWSNIKNGTMTSSRTTLCRIDSRTFLASLMIITAYLAIYQIDWVSLCKMSFCKMLHHSKIVMLVLKWWILIGRKELEKDGVLCFSNNLWNNYKNSIFQSVILWNVKVPI